MPREQLYKFLRRIHRAESGRDVKDMTDADLLERFATHREETAFASLLERHGPLVLGVCRRVLGNAEDADDAFQATFLVLVRKAGSIRKSASVASWLYGVAYRVSLEARSRAARRRLHEKRAENAEQADPLAEAVTRDLRAILDEELEQLPAKYRSPLVLHYLEGRTKEDTARQLGWTEGTVSGRLARARELLRSRLNRRGLLLPGGMLTVALSQEAATAAVPASQAESIAKLAMLFSLGQVAADTGAARITALTEKVVRTMLLSRLKIATGVLLAALGLGAGGLIFWAKAEQPASEQERVAPAHAPAHPAGLSKDPSPVAWGKKEGPILRIPMPDRTMMTVALSANGKLLAVSRQDRTTVQLWDVTTGKELKLTGHAFSVTALAFTPDGKTLASATGSWLPDGAPGEIKLWDVATGKERLSLARLPTMVLSLAFSADGKILASASGTVKLWEVDTGKEKLDLKVSGGIPWSLAFTPDGKTLAAGVGVREDNTPGSVVLWDLTTGKERAILPGHVGTVSCVAFTPDGKTLASADSRGTVKLWDVANAKERSTIPNPAHSFFLQSLVVASDGQTVIATLMGKEGLDLKEWEVAGGKERTTYRGNAKNGFPLGLSGDGTIVVLGSHLPAESNQGTMELWELRSLRSKRPQKPEQPAGAPSQPVAQKEPGWLADASRADLPDRPATGRLHSKAFAVETARIAPYHQFSGNVGDPPEKQGRVDGAVLTLQQGKDRVPHNYYTIFLAVKPGETVDGRVFVVPVVGLFKQTEKIIDKDGKGWFFPVAGVQANSQESGGKPRTDLLPKVTMKLEFGKRDHGRLPGKIYLCIDDKEKSFVAGSFHATVDQEDKK
jgi:RNA polymerase sigma factor (sigma-70 family)